jgi:hypothetical protein
MESSRGTCERHDVPNSDAYQGRAQPGEHRQLSFGVMIVGVHELTQRRIFSV